MTLIVAVIVAAFVVLNLVHTWVVVVVVAVDVDVAVADADAEAEVEVSPFSQREL